MPDSPHSDLRFSGWHALRLDSHWCPRPGWLDTGGHRPSTLHPNHLGSPSIEWVKDNHSFMALYVFAGGWFTVRAFLWFFLPMGWGGLITFNGTSTHTDATHLVSCTCTHT